MITCPFCKRTSYHRMDEEQRYCSFCDVFIDDVLTSSTSVRRAMAAFSRRLAEQTESPEKRAKLLWTAEVWEPPPVVVHRGDGDAI